MINRLVIAALPEGFKLKACDLFNAGALAHATEARTARQSLLRSVKQFAEDGKVAVVWSGRDCDGVRYHNDVRLIDASIVAVDEHIAHTYEWADGPCSYWITTPAYGRTLSYESRDLVMEAHEDGHSHVIYD